LANERLKNLPRKLDNFNQDILMFLEKHEPNMLRYNEIVNGLWFSYQKKYLNQKGFRAALSHKLKHLKKEGYIKKEGIFYGTIKSSS
jgi:hypothetical protein